MEKYPNVGGYVYALNNPIKYIDPDGRDIVYFDVNGNELVNKRVVSNKIYETHIARNNDQTSFSNSTLPHESLRVMQSDGHTFFLCFRILKNKL